MIDDFRRVQRSGKHDIKVEVSLLLLVFVVKIINIGNFDTINLCSCWILPWDQIMLLVYASPLPPKILKTLVSELLYLRKQSLQLGSLLLMLHP